MSPSVEELAARGRDALAAGKATRAIEAFRAALEEEESGDLLAGLAEAVYLQGDYETASELFERAFVAYGEEGRPLDAARIARIRAYQCVLDGDWAVLNGWVSRARRLVEDAGDDGVERQWLEVFGAMDDPDPGERERRLLAVAETARRLGDPSLRFDAFAVLGQLYVFTGRTAEGMALLDEALTAVCAGEVEEFVVIEGAFCLMLSACELTQDVGRAEQWVRSADDLVAHRDLHSLPPLCRGYYGGILTAAGRYVEAEEALTEAARGLETGYRDARTNALARLADVRLRQGRLEEAAQLLVGLEEHPDAAAPLAALHLARGEVPLARERVERALDEAEGATAGRLLALLVDVQLAEGSPGDAADTARRLEESAEEHGSRYLRAAAALARGRVCVAEGSSDARTCLREALAGFSEARMPLELARSRLELARAVVDENREVAIAEAKAALDAAEGLAAAPLADMAAAFLRTHGAPVRVGPKGVGALTKREAEVLELLGHGLSNAGIAERLVISPKTAEHHVGRILSKLSLRNRAEAAAFAVRRAGEEKTRE